METEVGRYVGVNAVVWRFSRCFVYGERTLTQRCSRGVKNALLASRKGVFPVQIALLGMKQWSSRLGMVFFVDNRGVISLEVLLEYHNVGQGAQKLTLGSSASVV